MMILFFVLGAVFVAYSAIVTKKQATKLNEELEKAEGRWSRDIVRANWREHRRIFRYVGLAICMVVLITSIFLGGGLVKAGTIPAKIEMYEAENAAIELRVAAVVEQYLEYEGGVFRDVAPDEAMVLVALYPELKADEMIAKQIELYVSNHQQIVALKEQLINVSVLRWWLYFGG